MDIWGIYIHPFFLGVFGSFGVEVAIVVSYYQDGQPLPLRFKTVGFYISQAFLAVIAGLLVVAHDVEKPLAALHLGVSAPALFLAMRKRRPAAAAE